MPTLTKEAIVRALGPVSDRLATAIADTGCTEDELRDAHAWLASDEAAVNDMRHLPGGRVGRVIELLAPAEEESDRPPTSGPSAGLEE